MEQYDLLSYLNLVKSLTVSHDLKDSQNAAVKGLTYNSKDVTDGTLFICKGISFKEEYLEEAIKRGAAAYISEVKYEVDLPCIIVSDIRKTMPILADKFFNSPQNDICIIGVGGTKGKTTTSFYIKTIIDAYSKRLGEKGCGILSSIITYDGVKEEVSHNTTPEAVELYRHLRRAVDSGLKYMVMEVSSQALKYNRVDGISYDVGVFLNISEDHISPIEHKDFEDYFNSKMIMFGRTKHAVVNLDIDYRDEVLANAKKAEDIHTFSMKDLDADVFGHSVVKANVGSEFIVKCRKYEEKFSLSMPGLFNVDNALAAVSVGNILGISTESMREGLAEAKVTGRMEIFHSLDDELIAIVDYAHNKLSFESLFSSIKKEFPAYHITAVFGAPGGKAFQRREELGSVAGKYADEVILTADEPGFEKVSDICAEIAKYVEAEGCPYKVVEDRGEALQAAVNAAKGKTLIVAAGKGHEGSQKIGNKYIETPSDIDYMKTYIKLYDNRRG